MLDEPKEILIEVLKWEKKQGRKDVKVCSWFKLDHKICEDPDFFDLSHGEFKFWIYLLSMCSRQNTSCVTINTEHAHRVSGIDNETVHQAIQKLKHKQMIRIRTLRGRYARGTPDKRRGEEKRREERRGEEKQRGTGDRLILLWNEFSKLPKVKTITTHLRILAQQAFLDHPSHDFWRELFSKIEQTTFLTGQNKTGWKADFAWVMSKGNYGRIADDSFAGHSEINWENVFGKEESNGLSPS